MACRASRDSAFAAANRVFPNCGADFEQFSRVQIMIAWRAATSCTQGVAAADHLLLDQFLDLQLLPPSKNRPFLWEEGHSDLPIRQGNHPCTYSRETARALRSS